MNTIKTVINPKSADKNKKQENKTMATNTPKTTTPAQKPTTTPPAAAAPATTEAPKKDRKEAKVRLYSQVAPEFYVRVFQSFLDKHGIPDHGGKPMVRKADEAKGAGKKAEREAAKAAEKEKMAKMSNEEKLAYAKEKREKAKAEKDAKKKAEKEALIAQIKAEMAAGKL